MSKREVPKHRLPTQSHLYLATQVVLALGNTKKPEYDRVMKAAYETMTISAVDIALKENNGKFTEEDINLLVADMIADALLQNMVSDGLLEAELAEDGDTIYTATALVAKKFNAEPKPRARPKRRKKP